MKFMTKLMIHLTLILVCPLFSYGDVANTIKIEQSHNFNDSCKQVYLMLLMDNSASMNDVFDIQKSIAQELIEHSMLNSNETANVVTALILFSDTAMLELEFGDDKNEIIEKIKILNTTKGSTQLASAVSLATKSFRLIGSENGTKVIVLLTDGKSEDPWSSVVKTSQELHQLKPEVYAMSISSIVMERELEQYTRNRSRIYRGENVTEFKSELSRILKSVNCNQEKYNNTLFSPVEQDMLDNTSMNTQQCVNTTNVMVILDSARGVLSDFEKARQLAVDVAKLTKRNDHRIAVVSFSDNINLVIPLNQTYKEQDMVEKIINIKQGERGMDTYDAVHSSMKILNQQNTSDTDQVILLINSGNSKDHWTQVQKASEMLKNQTKQLYIVNFNQNHQMEHFGTKKENIFTEKTIDQFLGNLEALLKHGNCSSDQLLLNDTVELSQTQVVERREVQTAKAKKKSVSNERIRKSSQNKKETGFNEDQTNQKPSFDKIKTLQSKTETPVQINKEQRYVIFPTIRKSLLEFNRVKEKAEIKFNSTKHTENLKSIDLKESSKRSVAEHKAKETNETNKESINIGITSSWTTEDCDPVDIMLILDTSGSVKEVFEHQRQLALDIVTQLPIVGDWSPIKVALVRFAAFPHVEVRFADDLNQDELVEKILNITFTGGSTQTAYAVKLAVGEIARGRRSNVPAIVILINDGDSADHWFLVSRRSKELQKLTNHIYAVTFNVNAYLPELVIYTGNKSNVYQGQIGAARFLRDIRQLAGKCNGRTTIAPQETFVESFTSVTNQSNCSEDNIDLILIMDTSGRTEEVFLNHKTLAIETVKKLPSEARVSIGVVKFNITTGRQHLFLSNGQNVDSAIVILEALHYTKGNTSTAETLRLGAKELLMECTTDRKLIVVVMSDPQQNIGQTVSSIEESLKNHNAAVFGVSYSNNQFSKFESEKTPNGSRIYFKHHITDYNQNIQKVINEFTCSSIQQMYAHNCPKMDLVFIIDTFGSRTELKRHRNVALSLIDQLLSTVDQKMVRIGVITFGKSAMVQIPLTSEQRDVQKAIEKIKFKSDGPPYTAEAVQLALTHLEEREHSEALKVVVLMHDGNSQDLHATVGNTSRKLAQTADEIFVVALGEEIYRPELLKYAQINERIYQDKDTAKFLTDVTNLLGNSSDCPRTPITCDQQKIDFIIIVDSTGPSAQVFRRNQNIMIDIVGEIPIHTGKYRFSLINFADDWATISMKLTKPKNGTTVINALTALQYVGGKTVTEMAILLALHEWETAKQPDTKPVFLMILNNQESADDPQVLVEAGAKLRNAGGTTYACAFQSNKLRQDLLSFSSNEQSNVFLNQDINRFLTEIHHLTNECSENDIKRELESTEITMRADTDFSIKNVFQDIAKPQPHFTTPAVNTQKSTFEPGCTLDILYIMDASGSMESVFNRSKKMAVGILNYLKIDLNKSQVAMIKFAGPGKSFTVFPFGRHKNNDDIINAIENLSLTSGITNVNEALKLALKLFNGAHRQSVAVPIIFIFTDGYTMYDTLNTAKELRLKVPNIFAVATGESVNLNELINITGNRERVFSDQNLRELVALLDNIVSSCV